MELTLTNPIGSAAGSSCWLLLWRNFANDNSGAANADAKTTAASCTSSGQPFTVSFSVAAPPAASSLCFHCNYWVSTPPRHVDDDNSSNSKRQRPDHQLRVIAAHDDSVLIEMTRPPQRPGGHGSCSFEYFLYESGAARPPSLSLLPGCYISMQFQRDRDAAARDVPSPTSEARYLGVMRMTGILRRGQEAGQVLVAQLEVTYDEPRTTAELCVFRPGGHDWVLRRLPIVRHDGGGELRYWTGIDETVPVGGRFMCWVDYLSGFLLCDMAAEENKDPNNKLRYVPLPVPPPETAGRRSNNDRPYMRYCRSLAAAGPGAVRFVSIAPRCCCGGPGKTSCDRSLFAFNVTTWSLALTTSMEEPMTWVKDGVLDCDELWQLPNYGSLPRVTLEYPFVSANDPDIVCFTVCENHYFIDGADDTTWMLEINTRTKALLSVVRSDDIRYKYSPGDLIPAKLHW